MSVFLSKLKDTADRYDVNGLRPKALLFHVIKSSHSPLEVRGVRIEKEKNKPQVCKTNNPGHSD